jgi:hypothetical protein
MTPRQKEIVAALDKYGSVVVAAKNLGLDRGYVDRLRLRFGVKMWNRLGAHRLVIKHNEGRVDLDIENGTAIVFSDAHYWPGVRTTAHRALLALIKQLKPVAVICNGDAFDGGTISRYPRIGWDKKPSVIEELNAVDAALTEIEEAAKGAHLIWPLGNHDARYEKKLAASAPEFEGVRGFHLKDHFPSWKPCWTTWINEEVCVTHYYHSGIHAVHNNILKGQCHYVTGHTHSLKVTPWTNAKGDTLYGVDTGCLADALSSHNLDYQQGRHGNHRSGFAVLSFRDSRLLMPELVQVYDENTVQFRGHLLNADTGELV